MGLGPREHLVSQYRHLAAQQGTGGLGSGPASRLRVGAIATQRSGRPGERGKSRRRSRHLGLFPHFQVVQGLEKPYDSSSSYAERHALAPPETAPDFYAATEPVNNYAAFETVPDGVYEYGLPLEEVYNSYVESAPLVQERVESVSYQEMRNVMPPPLIVNRVPALMWTMNPVLVPVGGVKVISVKALGPKQVLAAPQAAKAPTDIPKLQTEIPKFTATAGPALARPVKGLALPVKAIAPATEFKGLAPKAAEVPQEKPKTATKRRRTAAQPQQAKPEGSAPKAGIAPERPSKAVLKSGPAPTDTSTRPAPSVGTTTSKDAAGRQKTTISPGNKGVTSAIPKPERGSGSVAPKTGVGTASLAPKPRDWGADAPAPSSAGVRTSAGPSPTATTPTEGFTPTPRRASGGVGAQTSPGGGAPAKAAVREPVRAPAPVRAAAPSSPGGGGGGGGGTSGSPSMGRGGSGSSGGGRPSAAASRPPSGGKSSGGSSGKSSSSKKKD